MSARRGEQSRNILDATEAGSNDRSDSAVVTIEILVFYGCFFFLRVLLWLVGIRLDEDGVFRRMLLLVVALRAQGISLAVGPTCCQ